MKELETSAPTFGPSALATPANAVTAARLVISPLLLVFIADDVTSWAALTIWVLLAGTDLIDGWLARRQGATRSGAFLDPLADKVLVLGAMWALVAAGRFSVVAVGLITAREVAIQGFRSYWGRRGLAVPATWWAKVKTLVQAVAVGLAFLPPLEDNPGVADGVLWASVVLTLATGAQYLHDGSRATRLTGSSAA
ncbi:MAG: CDP-alcohol phosphatidyltransferase family protein [Acidimicrobiales bacterium]